MQWTWTGVSDVKEPAVNQGVLIVDATPQKVFPIFLGNAGRAF